MSWTGAGRSGSLSRIHAATGQWTRVDSGTTGRRGPVAQKDGEPTGSPCKIRGFPSFANEKKVPHAFCVTAKCSQYA
jgi:hypothetical protein